MSNLRSRNLRDRNQGYPQDIHTLPLDERAHTDPSLTEQDRQTMARLETERLYTQNRARILQPGPRQPRRTVPMKPLQVRGDNPIPQALRSRICVHIWGEWTWRTPTYGVHECLKCGQIEWEYTL